MGPELYKGFLEAREEASKAVKRMNSFLREIISPLAASYYTKDGRVIGLCIIQTDLYWSKFCQAIERLDLEHDPRFDSHYNRLSNRGSLVHILDEVFSTRTLEEWKTRLGEIPFAPLQNMSEVANDPQAEANNYFVKVDHPLYGNLRVIANPLNFGETPATYRIPAPVFW